MPNINLRLTDEEHEALRTWAFEGRRSIQREIIFRLFANDLPKHVRDAVTEQEAELTKFVREETSFKDAVVEYDLSPILTRPSGKCQMNVPAGTKCKVCGKVHPL